MSEQDENPPPSVPRRTVEVALARVEAKLDVAIAQPTERLGEHGRRIAANEAAVGAHEVRIGSLEQHKAASDAREQAEAAAAPPKSSLREWGSFGISILLALYIVLDHFQPPGL